MLLYNFNSTCLTLKFYYILNTYIFLFLDQIIKCNNFHIDLLEPNLAINKTDKLAIAKNTENNLYLVDIMTGKQITSVKLPKRNSGTRCIEEEFVNNDLLAICEVECGATDIYDFRTNSICCNLLSGKRSLYIRIFVNINLWKLIYGHC